MREEKRYYENKRGDGTADISFRLVVQYSDSPTHIILTQFRAVTVGIVVA